MEILLLISSHWRWRLPPFLISPQSRRAGSWRCFFRGYSWCFGGALSFSSSNLALEESAYVCSLYEDLVPCICSMFSCGITSWPSIDCCSSSMIVDSVCVLDDARFMVDCWHSRLLVWFLPWARFRLSKQ